MPHRDLSHKLDPKRFPNMTPQMGAIPGYLLENTYTTPSLVELTVTPDGHLLGRSDGDGGFGQTVHMGSESDLRANLRRLGMAAGLDEAEWVALRKRVRVRLGIDLGGLEPEGRA
jgi:hypothetical protein